jgi:hypothetical protein
MKRLEMSFKNLRFTKLCNNNKNGAYLSVNICVAYIFFITVKGKIAERTQCQRYSVDTEKMAIIVVVPTPLSAIRVGRRNMLSIITTISMQFS